MNLQQKKDNSFLATEPLGRLLLKLSLPTVTAQVINMLYNIVDRIYIGHIPETGALALTGVGVPLQMYLPLRSHEIRVSQPSVRSFLL